MEQAYQELARLFEYPGETYGSCANQCLDRLNGEQDEVLRALETFAHSIEKLTLDELQELFTRTFDLNPACSLEIGWHLFGEDYKRGEFLVKMRQQLRAMDVPESTELPDHLTHALELLGRMDADEATAFAQRYVLPALDKMLTGWEKNRNAFAELLRATFLLLKSRYQYEPERQQSSASALRVLQ